MKVGLSGRRGQQKRELTLSDWSSGIVSACRLMGREIEACQGILRKVVACTYVLKKKISLNPTRIKYHLFCLGSLVLWSLFTRKEQGIVGSNLRTGVDVMITIFCDFRQFSSKKLAFFVKNQCYDQNFA
jgi:hypothetical protein